MPATSMMPVSRMVLKVLVFLHTAARMDPKFDDLLSMLL